MEWEKQFAYLVEGFQFFPSHAVSWMNHDIDIWNFNTMVLDAKLTGHQKKVNCVLADPTNQVILSGSSDRTLKIWDLATGACTQTLIGHTAAINSISFCKDLISSGGNDKYIRIWDRRTNSQIDSFKISNNLLIPQGTYSSSVSFLTPKTLALSDSKVAVGSNDHLIRLYDCRKQYFPLKVLTPVLTSSSPNPSFNLSPVISLAINNRRILSGHSDGSLQDWYFDKYL